MVVFLIKAVRAVKADFKFAIVFQPICGTLTLSENFFTSTLNIPKPFVILKLDDLWCEDGLVYPGWEQVVNFLNEQGIKGTIGIIGSSLEDGNPAYFNWIKKHI